MNNIRRFSKFLCRRKFSSHSKIKLTDNVNNDLKIRKPEYDLAFLCDPANRDAIRSNIKLRKGVGDIDKVVELAKNPSAQNELWKELEKIPNQTAPGVSEYGAEPRILRECGVKRNFDFQPLPFDELAKKLNLMRIEQLGPIAGERSYILIGDLAQMEEALTRYSIKKLLENDFRLVSVPDVLPTRIIELCGLVVNNERTLIYELDSRYEDDLSLSGTAEMALAAKLMNSEFPVAELPVKLAAVSRCFRAEISNNTEERGLYRVHQFTKVEMFACSEPDNSSEVMNELRDIQQSIFAGLGIHFKVLDMPAHELGAPAYRKWDIEGWFPGKQQYGELSSCSNCTDFQSRRLNIKYKTKNEKLRHVHTLNGTACAIPRMLMAICETNQTMDGHIVVPEVLVPYMRGKTLIEKQPIAPMRDYKYKPKKNQ